MAGLRAERPPEFSNDERWFKIFTTKSLIVFLIMSLIGYLIARFFILFGLTPIGIMAALLLVTMSMVVVMVPLPGKDVLNGSGMTLDVMLFQMLVRKKRACIYVKMCQTGDDES